MRPTKPVLSVRMVMGAGFLLNSFAVASVPFWQTDFDTFALTTVVTPDSQYLNTLNGQNGWWGLETVGEVVPDTDGRQIARIGSLRTWKAELTCTSDILVEPWNKRLTVSIAFFQPGTGLFEDQIIFTLENRRQVIITFLRNTNKNIRITANGLTYLAGSWNPGTRYPITFFKDDVAHTFAMTINGQTVQGTLPANAVGISTVMFYGGGNTATGQQNPPYTRETNKSYFGDITMTMEPIPDGRQTAFPVGWWSRSDCFWVDEMEADGTNLTLLYNMDSSIAVLDGLLNDAYVDGLKVILQLPRQDGVVNADPAVVTAFVQHFDSHPALYGWYIADEPGLDQHAACKSAYDTIKLASSKPVTIVFCREVIDCIDDFADAYDILLFDKYTAWDWIPEFGNLEPGTLGNAKANIGFAAGTAARFGKPWMIVLQGFGKVTYHSLDWRLPTFAEERFLLYYALDKGATGWLNWCKNFCKDTIAASNDPYPFNGVQWNLDVYRPLVAEINVLGPALAAGRLSTSLVGDNNSSIETGLWQDPVTGSYYLIALNTSATDGEAVVTLALACYSIRAVRPLFEGRSPVAFMGNSFTDSFTQYQVHVYNVTFRTSGDANDDTKVDVGDLGILAANYGMTSGATWDKGDFNSDGEVDVSDLGILAANYGTGSGSSLDFDRDAQALGLTISNDQKATESVSTLEGCNGMGLPLVAGLLLAGLMLVKLEE